MDRIVISVLDENKTVDKLKVTKRHINKKFLDATGEDYVIIVSKEVGEFINKHI